MKPKNTKIIFVAILAILLTCIIFYNSLGHGITLVYMYCTNEENITFNNMSLVLPFNYARDITDQDLTFSRYPSGDGYAYITSNFDMNKEEFSKKYKLLTKKFKMEPYAENDILINNIRAYFLGLRSTESPDIADVYILIPSKRVMINYYGSYNKWDEYYSVIKSIIFIK